MKQPSKLLCNFLKLQTFLKRFVPDQFLQRHSISYLLLVCKNNAAFEISRICTFDVFFKPDGSLLIKNYKDRRNTW